MSTKPFIDKKCRVCGDRALAFNFNGLSCECCKIFFRRNAANPEKLQCRKSGNCEIDFCSRRCCPKCRLNKCFSIGMDLGKPKRRNRKKKCPPLSEDAQATTTTNNESPLNMRTILLAKDSEPEVEQITETSKQTVPAFNIKKVPLPSSTPPNKPDYFHKKYSSKMKTYEHELLAQLKTAMAVFEDESALPCAGTATELQDVFNLSGLYARRIVKLCKGIPPFKTFNSVDQFAILKRFYFDITAIRIAFLFNREKDGFYFISSETGDKSIFVPIDLCNNFSNKEISKIHRKFLSALNEAMEADSTILNLVIAQAMFTHQEGTMCPEVIHYYRCQYSHLLERYLEKKCRSVEKATERYALLQSILQNLGIIHENLQTAILELDLSQLTEVVYEVMDLANRTQ